MPETISTNAAAVIAIGCAPIVDIARDRKSDGGISVMDVSSLASE
ncbi:hypothetical protein [Rhodopseudomonas infernalis]|nr:hypothetical protein [Rhodopseudomonas infernalis]